MNSHGAGRCLNFAGPGNVTSQEERNPMIEPESARAWPKVAAIIAGAVSALLGLAVLFAWHSHHADLIQVGPASGYMVYNTAVGFVLAGSGLAAVYAYPRFAVAAGFLLTLLGVLTLSQYLFGIDLGLDQLLFTHYLASGSDRPGQVAFNTALCLTLSGAALVLAGASRPFRCPPFVPGLMGAITAAIGLVALFGYLTGIPFAYGWGGMTRMAPLTAAGFLVLGNGVVAAAWAAERRMAVTPRWLPFLVAIGSATTTMILWQSVTAQEHAQIALIMDLEAAGVGNALRSQLEGRTLELVRFARHLEVEGLPDAPGWQAATEFYVRQHPGTRLVGWADSSLQVRKVVPRAGNERVLGLDLRSDTRRRRAIDESIARHEARLSPPLDLFQGGRGVIAYVPIFRSGRCAGLLYAVFTSPDTFSSSLQVITGRLSVSILVDGEELYRNQHDPAADVRQWDREIRLALHGTVWRIRVAPTQEMMAELQSPHPTVVLIGGICITILLSLSMYLFQSARDRFRQSEAANRELVGEIAERKRVTDKVRKLSQAVEQCASVIVITDNAGLIEYVNPRFLEVIGYAPDEVIGNHLQILKAEEQTAGFTRQVWETIRTGSEWSGEVRSRRKTDEEFWALASISPIRNDEEQISHYVVVIEDIDASKQAEAWLQRSNELLRALIEASPLAIYLLNPDGTIQLWNRSAELIFGWPSEEVTGRSFPTTSVAQQEESLAQFARVVSGECLVGVELQRQRKDGTDISIDLHAAPVYDHQGSICGVMAVAADISERKRFERELQHSERKFRTAFEDAAIGMYLTGLDGKFLMVNRSFCAMLGYTREELSDLTSHDVTLADDRDKSYRWHAAMLEGASCPNHMQKRYQHRDGQVVWGMVSKILFRDDDGQPLYFICQVQDITEQKKMEGQLLHAQKMEAIGTLTGGIAHDFNNILTAIIGYGSLLEMKLAGDESAYHCVKSVLGAAERAVTLTQSLLAFGRKREILPQPMDLNSIVSAVEKLLGRLLREDIELRINLAEQALTVMADAGQIEQVLMNLATNARDAMPDGGMFFVSTGQVAIDQSFLAAHGYGRPGRYVLLTVSDTGSGMDEATRLRIYEPFFTTKEVGKGTGLGLAMVYGTVKQHDGFITCYSESGRGTTFRIYLPTLDGVAVAGQAAEKHYPCGAGETILLAEDDSQVRGLTRELLENYGYRVIEAVDGEEAIQLFSAHEDDIRLTILDVIMPRKNGRETYEELRRMKPGLKTLFTSGYSTDIFKSSELEVEGTRFISKPIAPTELLQSVRMLLDT
jgi:PAS domain S-box-containing protein